MTAVPMFTRSRSDDNILNSIETMPKLPKAKRLPPPPPPPYIYKKKPMKPPMPTPIEEPLTITQSARKFTIIYSEFSRRHLVVYLI